MSCIGKKALEYTQKRVTLINTPKPENEHVKERGGHRWPSPAQCVQKSIVRELNADLDAHFMKWFFFFFFFFRVNNTRTEKIYADYSTDSAFAFQHLCILHTF